MKGMAGAALVLLGAMFVSALGLHGGALGQWPWFISRASGLVAFGLLTGSVVMGLLVRTKVADGVLARPLTFELHQFLAILTLVLLGVHAGSLLFDGFFQFTPVSVVVPFAAPYRPLWTGLGVVAGWAAALVAASFWARRRIGQRRWRQFHYISFGAYLLALVHGLTAGTDSGLALVYLFYGSSSAAVFALLAYRILAPRPKRQRVPSRLPLGSLNRS